MNFIIRGYFIISTNSLWLHVRLCVQKKTCLGHPFTTSKGASGILRRIRRFTGILRHKIFAKSSYYYAVLSQALLISQEFSHVAVFKNPSFSVG